MNFYGNSLRYLESILKAPKVTEATALGAAMAAGVGAGIYENIVNASDALVV